MHARGKGVAGILGDLQKLPKEDPGMLSCPCQSGAVNQQMPVSKISFDCVFSSVQTSHSLYVPWAKEHPCYNPVSKLLLAFSRD